MQVRLVLLYLIHRHALRKPCVFISIVIGDLFDKFYKIRE
ncbi:MAG: BC10 family protein [Clostridia bacterium]|nr:BC10 family protein [Clostridia bacterium]